MEKRSGNGGGTSRGYRETLVSVMGIPFTDGNRIDILKNGVEIFPAMLEAISAARRRIDMVTYVYWRGEIARRFAEALSRKAREGVGVRLILDAFGAKPMRRRLIRMMTDAGVHIRWFRPLARWNFWTVNNRTHRKVLVCDGEVAFTGGVGIAREWEGDARDPSEWRETHFRVRGPAVHGLHSAFLENWIETGAALDLSLDSIGGGDPVGGVPIQTLRTDPSVRWSDTFLLFSTLLLMARRRVTITTAYFDPDRPMIRLFRKLRDRGVEVEVLAPGRHMDVWVAKVAAEANYDVLFELGVHLWHYQRTMLHAKIILIDDQLACIGSANFNQRSMRHDDEVILVLLDPARVRLLREQFQEDLADARRLTPESWRKRGGADRMKKILVDPFRHYI